MTSLALVPAASRYLFAARGKLRVVEPNEVACFKTFKDLTREQIAQCPSLADLLVGADVPMYLAEYGGVPGIVKGCADYGYGMTVFSEDLKFMVVVDEARVSENRIKFNHGALEFRERRDECWEFAVLRQRINIITEIEKAPPAIFPVVITRETECPICKDDLGRSVVSCIAKHQICLPCYNLMSDVGRHKIKKCPLCNVPNYTTDEIYKVDMMNGIEVEHPDYIHIDLDSGGSNFKDYLYNEALFFHMLKTATRFMNMDNFRRMLLSSLCNFYMNHEDKLSTYNFNFTHYCYNDTRRLRPMEDDVGDVIMHYVDTVYSDKFKSIYDDVAYTKDIYAGVYDERDFYRELIDLEGNVDRVVNYPGDELKNILKREVYFRYKVKHSNKNEMIEYFKNIITRIIQNVPQPNIHSNMFKRIRKEIINTP